MFPPVTVALLSALGRFRDASGGFTSLQSDKAREVLEFYGDLIHRHRLLKIGDYDIFPYVQAGTWGIGFGTIAFSDITASSAATIACTPFPSFGSGRNPPIRSISAS